MKNNNDNLKEKAIKVNELENASGGSDHGPPYRMVIGGTCIKRDCGQACNNACTEHAIGFGRDCRYDGGVQLFFNRSRCNGCGRCADVCPTGQIMNYS